MSRFENDISIECFVLFSCRANDENNDRPCFPTRNDRMAFINDNIIAERCVGLNLNRISKNFFVFDRKFSVNI